jgi:glycosyltransferase involved in cell wall biosynthesis
MDNSCLKKNQPLVTIGIPTYNRYDKLKNCLENVLHQTYYNLDILISDNTTNINKPDWLSDLIKKDLRFRYRKQKKNIGAIGNHQYLIDNAFGEYFMFLHDDDTIPSNYVEVLMDYLIKNSKVSLIGPRCDRYLDGNFWYSYATWDSRGKPTFERLKDLISDAFNYHWRFEQYIYGIFKIKDLNYKVSRDFKSQFHLFFLLSSKGELMCAPEIVLQKHTTNEELEKYKSGSTYRRHSVLKCFNDKDVNSIQQCTPIFFQMLFIILKSNMKLKLKYCLFKIITYKFYKNSILIELRDYKKTQFLKLVIFIMIVNECSLCNYI